MNINYVFQYYGRLSIKGIVQQCFHLKKKAELYVDPFFGLGGGAKVRKWQKKNRRVQFKGFVVHDSAF